MSFPNELRSEDSAVGLTPTLRLGFTATLLTRRQRAEDVVNGTRGELAQLGERFHGMEEVSGSIPLFSTTLFFAPR